MSATTPTTWIGQRVLRQEDTRLVTGAGNYTDDVSVHGELFCAIARSERAHAHIRSIDTSAARSMRGVVAVITGEEASKHWKPIPPILDMPTLKRPTFYAIATDKVHFVGEPVAAIAAETREIAEDAARAIVVEYEDLPPVVSMEEALEGDTLLYPDWGDNVQYDFQFAHGEVEAGFARAAAVVKERIVVHRYSCVPLEARAVLAQYDARSNELFVHMANQIPHQARSVLADMFDVPESRVRVVAPDVGGGYGNKMQLDVEPVPVLLSMLLERPVKWVENRTEWMISGPQGRDYVHEIEAAFDADGHILALRDGMLCDMGCDGAVRAGGGPSPVVALTYLPGAYRIDAIATRARGIVTNKPAYAACRGYGKDMANVGMERVMDRAALELGLDKGEIRRRNLVDEFPYRLVTGPVLESGSFLTCLNDLEEMMDLPALRAEQERARAEGRYLGIGLVMGLEPSGSAIPASLFSGFESAKTVVSPDGSVTVYTGVQPIGQGTETTMAQIAADALGCRPDDVRVMCGDTSTGSYGLGSYASRGTMYGGSAVAKAGARVRAKLAKVAGHLLEAAPEDIDIKDGVAHVRGAPAKGVTFSEMAQAAYFWPGPYAMLGDEDSPLLEATVTWTGPSISWTPDEAGRIQMYTCHGGGAQGALVEVDRGTGQIQVHKIWMVHDVGTMINPAGVDQQIRGGVVMGFGGAVLEEFQYDDDGNPLVRTLRDYQMPSFASAPFTEIRHVETPSPVTETGAKGVGEAGLVATGTVIMAALEDALSDLDVKVMTHPLTPWRVLDMIDGAKDAAGR